MKQETCPKCGCECLPPFQFMGHHPIHDAAKCLGFKKARIDPGPAVPLEVFTEFRKEHGKDLQT